MKRVIFIVVLIAGTVLTVDDEWSEFKQTSKRQFRSAVEEVRRLNIFRENLNKIEEHNNHTISTYKLGVTNFADITPDEFLSLLTLKISKESTANRVFRAKLNSTRSALNETVDWRQEGVVTDVKNQEKCGSSWSFATIGALESHNEIINKKLLKLSGQQLIDCSSKYGSEGCKGGTIDSALEYVRDNGVAVEKDYPYTAEQGECRSNDLETTIQLLGYTVILNEDDLKAAVANVGPVVAAIDSTKMQFYKSGIFTNCSEEVNLNHAVLVVGYGEEENVKYWLVKNSWGTDWGESGYLRLVRGANQCGVGTRAFYPNLRTNSGFGLKASLTFTTVFVTLLLKDRY